MNKPGSSEKTSSGPPGLRRSPFSEHIGLAVAIVTAPKAKFLRRAALVGAVCVGGVGSIYVGSRAENKYLPEKPDKAYIRGALKDVTSLDGSVEIDKGANIRSADVYISPNDQGGGESDILGQLKEDIIVPKPLEGPDGWDAVKLPGTDYYVWFNVGELVGQNPQMAHYLSESRSQQYQQVGQVEVNPNGSVSRVEDNGSTVVVPGAGLSYKAPSQ